MGFVALELVVLFYGGFGGFDTLGVECVFVGCWAHDVVGWVGFGYLVVLGFVFGFGLGWGFGLEFDVWCVGWF